MRFFRLLFVLSSLLIIAACNDASDPKNVVQTKPASDVVVDYGNGVYYFDYTRASFGNALSKFLSEHNCRVEAVAGDGTALYGVDEGYFVVCR
jgi:hypothetical protein